MGAVPKSRISKRRKRNRRGHDKIQAVKLVRCQTCDAFHQPHHMCPQCGSFRGIQIIDIDEEF